MSSTRARTQTQASTAARKPKVKGVVVPKRLTKAEARSLTDEIKQDFAKLLRKVWEAHEGEAHIALGYDSWAKYFNAEFREASDATAYRFLQASRVMAQLPIGSPLALNEAQLRELTPLLAQPKQLREAWDEVVRIRKKPTAAQIRVVVQRRVDEMKAARRREGNVVEPPGDETGVQVFADDETLNGTLKGEAVKAGAKAEEERDQRKEFEALARLVKATSRQEVAVGLMDALVGLVDEVGEEQALARLLAPV